MQVSQKFCVVAGRAAQTLPSPEPCICLSGMARHTYGAHHIEIKLFQNTLPKMNQVEAMFTKEQCIPLCTDAPPLCLEPWQELGLAVFSWVVFETSSPNLHVGHWGAAGDAVQPQGQGSWVGLVAVKEETRDQSPVLLFYALPFTGSPGPTSPCLSQFFMCIIQSAAFFRTERRSESQFLHLCNEKYITPLLSTEKNF